MLLASRRLKIFAARYVQVAPTRTFSGSNLSSATTSIVTSTTTAPSSLRACLFIELAALAEAVDSYALETHGPRYSSRFALDLSALVPTLQAQAKERICGGRPVQIVRTFVYGVSASSSLSTNDSNNGGASSPLSQSQQASLDRSRFNTFRACTNEGFSMRVFHSKSDPQGLAGFAAAVALSADVVHACAPPPLLLQSSSNNVSGDQGPINASESTISSAASVDPNISSGSGYDIVIGLVGGSAFLPPLIRAAQHGKGVLMTTRFTPDFSSAWRERPTVFKSLIDAVPLESITPKLIVPFNDFRQGASFDVAAMIDKLAVYFATRFGPEASVTGSALGKAAAAAGIAKDLSRHRLSIRALVGRAPHVFVVSEESGGTNTNYSVRLVKQKKATNLVSATQSSNSDSNSTKVAESNSTQADVTSTTESTASSQEVLKEVVLESTHVESNSAEASGQDVIDVTQDSAILNESSVVQESQASLPAQEMISSNEENKDASMNISSTSTSPKTPKKKRTSLTPALSLTGIDELHNLALACGLVSSTKDSGSKTSLIALVKATLSPEKQPKSSATKADLVALLQANLDESKQRIEGFRTRSISKDS